MSEVNRYIVDEYGIVARPPGDELVLASNFDHEHEARVNAEGAAHRWWKEARKQRALYDDEARAYQNVATSKDNYMAAYRNALTKMSETAPELGRCKAERDALRHKAEQYDTIVSELGVSDGGQYRHDVLARINELRRRGDAMAEALEQTQRILDGVISGSDDDPVDMAFDTVVNALAAYRDTIRQDVSREE